MVRPPALHRAVHAPIDHPSPAAGSSTHGQEGGATWAAGAMAAADLGRPGSVAGARSARSGSAPPEGAGAPIPEEAQPAIIATTLKLLKTISVRIVELCVAGAPLLCCAVVGQGAQVGAAAGRRKLSMRHLASLEGPLLLAHCHHCLLPLLLQTGGQH